MVTKCALMRINLFGNLRISCAMPPVTSKLMSVRSDNRLWVRLLDGDMFVVEQPVMRLYPAGSMRLWTRWHILQVFSDDEARLLATFLAIPDHRLQPSERSMIRFAEGPTGAPEAIEGWFYPGRTYGHEFVYPKT
jgi:hypothetical protein